MRPIAAAALVIEGLAAPALAETNVGVTAAVNQDAKGIVGANVRTISLGDSVVFNQRIQTGGSGLVQVLLADGTTFMVGPNSDLVIDSFVYDPNAGTAQVTASFTKGVLRFIGGQTSKTPNGVTINTPVGTMGIRGAMVDVVLDPPAGTPPHVDMLFGNEVTLAQGQQLLGRLYAAGYSLALGADGSFDVLKTPPGWGSQIQAALAGQPGTTGGAAKGPGDGDAKKIAGNNSGNGVDKNTPGKDGLTKEERDALLYAAAHYDELRNFILNNQHPYGFVGGVLTSDEEYEEYGLPLQNAFELNGEDGPNPVFTKFGFDADNNPVAVSATLAMFGAPCSVALGGCLVYEGGTDGGELGFAEEVGYDPTQTVHADGYLLNHDDAEVVTKVGAYVPDLIAGLQCASCEDFIRWGFWGFQTGELQIGESEGPLRFDSTWVNGDLTTRAQLGALAVSGDTAEATYNGDAVGTVHNGADTYVATGDMQLDWSFADRAGTIAITNFDANDSDLDGKNLIGGMISLPSDPKQTGFGGWLFGDGIGIAQGAFVNKGSQAAAGVIGNFGFSAGYDYTASGVFMGAQPADTD